jgi:hypothetical protein
LPPFWGLFFFLLLLPKFEKLNIIFKDYLFEVL